MRSLPSHADGLPLYDKQSATGDQDAPNGDSYQRPIRYNGRNEPFAPTRLLRFAIGTILFFTGAWPSGRGIFRSSRSRFRRLLGKMLTVVLIGMGLICLFWDRLKDSDHDPENEPGLHNTADKFKLRHYLSDRKNGAEGGI
jgi:hypothetical protein